MPRRAPTLAAQELIIMKIVWRLGDVTVRDVYETVRRHRPIAYTTVMTTMTILEQKGFLKKTPEGRAFRYRAARAQGRVLGAMVREFVDRVFDGATRPLVAHLVSEGRLSKAERDELRRLIDEADDG
jgi:predicted transcriptional regulator